MTPTRRNWLKAWAKLAPFTTALCLLVAVHAWMLLGLSPRLRKAVLLTHSTTLANLKKEPLDSTGFIGFCELE